MHLKFGKNAELNLSFHAGLLIVKLTEKRELEVSFYPVGFASSAPVGVIYGKRELGVFESRMVSADRSRACSEQKLP